MATLFEKIKIGNLELKNRLVMCPMGFTTDIDGGISERQRDYLVERAKGGFALVYPATHFISNRFEPSQANTLENLSQAKRISWAVEQVHHYGAKFALQMSLGLGRVSIVDPFTAPKSASTCNSFWFPELVCDPYTKEEIAWLVDKFGYSASLAKNAGVDVIEIHAYGGYLIDQFISSIWNKRTDEYGGSLENRLRIVFELRDSVWKYCGKDFPIAIKVTPDHGFEGGRTLEEGIEMVKMLDTAGFTYIHLDYGAYETWHKAVTTVYQEDGCQLFIAEAVKKAGVKTPVMVQGKLDDPDVAERVAADGLGDLIGLGHPSLADPSWPVKVKNGLTDDIIPCIGCNECIYHELTNKYSTCAVNPLTGAEKDYALTPAEKDLRILVVGGGPGGLVSAINAVARGYEVELWEKESELGGTLRAAGSPSFKYNVKRYTEFLKKQILKYNVPVRLRREATVENVLAYGPDAVIMCGGANPIIPSIPGIEQANMLEATALLTKNLPTGQNVVVLGGGLVGCETALHLAGQGKNVTIVELLDDVLLTVKHATNNDSGLRELLANSNIKIMTGTKLVSATEGKVVVEKGESTDELLCDNLIISVGYKSDNTLAEALEEYVEKVFVIGDNKVPGKILDAVHQGFHTARLMDELMDTI